ncbi:hypothetical protein [Phenylobacterium sp.]|jgi:pimeloyl-ACP methyl ester carboxylesterase|uniref:alpha/beta fold hydrolase n=1 Tax=Phenylobacterium sp. TaxID=1871053 RepID=UPI002F927B0E
MRLVLLHSPLLGPLCWQPVCKTLALRGLDVEAPAWPKLSTLAVDCYAGLANAMAATIDAHGTAPAILVAHSGAGPLLPSVAALARTPVAGVIYCDAILPHPGLSWFDTAPPELRMQLRVGAEDGRLPSWDRWWPPGSLERLIPDEPLRTALLAELEPIPIDYFEELAPELEFEPPTAFLQLSGAYDDESRLAGRQGWPVVRLPLHHLAMLTHVEGVGGPLESLASRLC